MSITAAMGHQRPPSPRSQKLQYNLHRLVEHSTTAQFAQPIYGPDGAMYLPSSQPEHFFGSPTGMHSGVVSMTTNPYNDQFFEGNPYLSHGRQGLGIQYGSYELPSATHYVQESSIPRSMPYSSPSVRDNTPSTPQSTASNSARKTRSGRISSAQTLKRSFKDKNSRSARPKTTRQKAHSARAPHIDKPLSELTKDLTHVPIRDMDAWVHRSDEERQKEVEKRNGYIARPMNSFMLYRSAYAERTKVWCVQNNHQVVSAVSGESWPMEPVEIRDKYNELAKVERDNHAKAHPKYKFSPSKTGQLKRKKEAESDEDESEQSDIADNDSEWRPRSERSSSARTRRRQIREESQVSDSPLHNRYADPYFGIDTGFNGSSWEVSNEGRALPGFMEQWEPYSQYYHATAYPLVSAPGIEDLRMQPMPMLPAQYEAMPNGLPGTYHSDLLEFRSPQPTPVSYEPQLDPILGGFEEPTSQYEDGANLFGDEYDPAHSTSQFDEWMESEEQA